VRFNRRWFESATQPGAIRSPHIHAIITVRRSSTALTAWLRVQVYDGTRGRLKTTCRWPVVVPPCILPNPTYTHLRAPSIPCPLTTAAGLQSCTGCTVHVIALHKSILIHPFTLGAMTIPPRSIPGRRAAIPLAAPGTMRKRKRRPLPSAPLPCSLPVRDTGCSRTAAIGREHGSQDRVSPRV